MDSSNLQRAERAYDAYAPQLYRVAYSLLLSRESAEDAVQDAFARYLAQDGAFRDAEHEKAWLIVTASNLCKNALRHWWRRRENLDDYAGLGREDDPPDEVMEAITKLPTVYKDAVFLYYYEGYSTPEIAELLNCSQSTIRNRLMRARNLLKTMLGGEFDEQTRNTQSL